MRERKAAQAALDEIDLPTDLPLTPGQPPEAFNLNPERAAQLKDAEAKIAELDRAIATHQGR